MKKSDHNSKKSTIQKSASALAIAALALMGMTPAANAGTSSLNTQEATAQTFQQGRIINGTPASLADAPYIAAINSPDGYIGQGFDGKPDNHCGGTVIASNKVLSAAHCFAGTPSNILTVSVGRTNRTDGETARISDVWIHPEYRSASSGYDIAVLTLDRDVSVTPAELNFDASADSAGSPATVLGWGTTESGSSVDELLKVDVPLVSDADCSRSYSSYDSSTMLCAGFHEGGKDACQGDSGGPLVSNGRVTGIVSFGYGCALERYYGVYTRVSSFESDITEQLSR